MRLSFRRLLPVLGVIAVLVMLTLLTSPARALSLDDVWDGMTGAAWAWLSIPAFVLLLLAAGWLFATLGKLARERLHASRVARLFDTFAEQANGIAALLIAHPPATGGAALLVVRQAAIAQTIAYAKANLPDTIRAIGVSDDTMAARLNAAVDGKLLAVLPTLPDAARDVLQSVLLTGLGSLAAPPAEPAAAPTV